MMTAPRHHESPSPSSLAGRIRQRRFHVLRRGATFAHAGDDRRSRINTFNSTQRLDTAWLVNADNDLTQVGTSSTRASGTPLLLSGQLVNLSGAPVAGATIEIWQTDNNGLYYHSGNNYQARDQNFQFFGTTVTDGNGNYSFRTVRPGLYTGRIRHIHFKIKLNGTTLVTSQLMFEEDRAQFRSDMVAAQLGTSIDLVLINPVTGSDTNGGSVLVATRQLVVNASGSATVTGRSPVITAQPASASVAVGDTVSFSVTATSTTTMSYQWNKDGVALPGATAATLTLNSVTANNAGAYTVAVTNSSGSITSNAVTLAVKRSKLLELGAHQYFCPLVPPVEQRNADGGLRHPERHGQADSRACRRPDALVLRRQQCAHGSAARSLRCDCGEDGRKRLLGLVARRHRSPSSARFRCRRAAGTRR
jgi:protocatechuate 3,4-dioxygenase beta subunit